MGEHGQSCQVMSLAILWFSGIGVSHVTIFSVKFFLFGISLADPKTHGFCN
jgi:hypothetical protein